MGWNFSQNRFFLTKKIRNLASNLDIELNATPKEIDSLEFKKKA